MIHPPKKPRQYKTKSKAKRLLSIFAITFLIFLSIQVTLNITRISTITCQTDYGPCSPQIVASLNPLKGKQIFALDQKTVESVLSPKRLESIQIRLPNKLIVKVNIPKPVAALTVSSGEGKFTPSSFLVSKNGEILAEYKSQSLPKVETQLPFVPHVNSQLTDFPSIQAIKLASLLYQYGHTQVLIVASQDTLEIKNISEAKIISSPNLDPEAVATTLQSILSKATITQSIPKAIDLRYRQPILIYR